jgi:hypothetical protein
MNRQDRAIARFGYSLDVWPDVLADMSKQVVALAGAKQLQ